MITKNSVWKELKGRNVSKINCGTNLQMELLNFISWNWNFS
jgi:hypothetical protein